MSYQRALSQVICECANLTYMNCNERIIFMHLLFRYDDNDDDDDYTRDIPYDLHEAMMINKDIKDISKGTLA